MIDDEDELLRIQSTPCNRLRDYRIDSYPTCSGKRAKNFAGQPGRPSVEWHRKRVEREMQNES